MPALTFDDLLSPQSQGNQASSRIYVSPNKGEALTFDDITPESTTDQAIRYGKDVGLSVVSGLDKGVAGLAGAPADLGGFVQDMLDLGKSKVQGRPLADIKGETARDAVISRETLDKWGSRVAHENSPLRHDPTTLPGTYAQTGAEFLPGALLPGASVRNAVTLGLIPGLASEAAGQATKGTGMEGVARAVTALGAGGIGAWANLPNSAGSAVTRAARGVTPQQIDDAERLFTYAQQAGLPLTRAEAIQHVTQGATNLGNLQRVVEGQGGMRDFMAQRPAQIETATRGQLDTALGPAAAMPSNIGPQVGQGAENIVQGVQGAINRASRPYYQAAEAQRVGAPVHQALVADPLYAQTLNEVRNNPSLNRTIEHLPDDSVGVIDLVQRRMREQADNARMPGQANTSNLAAANFEDARTVPLAAADTVTGSRPGVAGAYETARDIQTQLRQQYLEPLMNGPIGKLAARDTTTKKAIEVLFPENPLPNSRQEVEQAVRALANQNPHAARELVRAHVESVFNEATQRLKGGLDEFGGAGFAAALRGNRQQAENLEASITALRGGQAYQGFDRFLQILEAQGTRQRVGSQTAFNQEVQSALKSGGTTGEALSAVATGGIKLPATIKQTIERWRLGRNVNEIADILVNPESAALFRRLATAPPNSQTAAVTTARLVYMAERGREDAK